jgi:hypothetical protein
VRLEVLDQLKNPMTSSGIEPATFQPVAWCLTQLMLMLLLSLRRVEVNSVVDVSGVSGLEQDEWPRPE